VNGECRGWRRRSAFLTGTVARNAPLRFRLDNAGWVSEQRLEAPHRKLYSYEIVVGYGNGTRAVRALLKRTANPCSLFRRILPVCHIHHAVVLPVAAAASGQIRIRTRPLGEKGRSHWKAEYGQ
jgi:hypothetical protein